MAKKHDQANNQLGNILRSLREEQGLTRELVAERADIGLRHLAAIELGEKKPSVDTLYRLLRVIGASADRVFYPERSKKMPPWNVLNVWPLPVRRSSENC